MFLGFLLAVIWLLHFHIFIVIVSKICCFCFSFLLQVHARTSVKVEGFDLPKKNPPKVSFFFKKNIIFIICFLFFFLVFFVFVLIYFVYIATGMGLYI